MQSPSPGRNKAQAPPGKGQDLGLSDVSWRRGDYGYCGGFFFGSSFFCCCGCGAGWGRGAAWG